MPSVVLGFLIFSSSTVKAITWKDFSLSNISQLKKFGLMNFIEFEVSKEDSVWTRTVTVSIPSSFDIAGLATAQIPFFKLDTNKENSVTFVTIHSTEQEANNILEFVDYLNKIPYRAEKIISDFQIGEEIRFKTQLSFLTGFSALPKLFISPMKIAGDTVISGNFSVIIKKISETEIEMSMTHINDQEKGVKGNIGTNSNLNFFDMDSKLNLKFKKFIPRVLDFSSVDNNISARTFSYKVDLNTANGKKFYNDLLGSALTLEDLKSVVSKNDELSLEELKKSLVHSGKNQIGVISQDFGALKSDEFSKKFNLGYLFKRIRTQKYSRIWYRLEDVKKDQHFYMMDEFTLAKGVNHLFGYGAVANERRTGKAFYETNYDGTPVEFLEFQLVNSFDLKAKESKYYNASWIKMIEDSFGLEEINSLKEYLDFAEHTKSQLKANVTFSIKDNFFDFISSKYGQESLLAGKSMTKDIMVNQLQQLISDYLNKIEKVDVITLNSCIGRVCDLFLKNKNKNSELYKKEIYEIASVLVEIIENKKDLKKKSLLLASLRKNPLFIQFPIGITSSLVDEDNKEKIFSYEISVENVTSKEKKLIKFGRLKKNQSKSIIETIKFLKGESLRPVFINKCLLLY